MVSNLKDYNLSVLTQIGSISSFEICEIKVLQGIEEKINLVKSVFLLKGKKAITHSVATRAISLIPSMQCYNFQENVKVKK